MAHTEHALQASCLAGILSQDKDVLLVDCSSGRTRVAAGSETEYILDEYPNVDSVLGWINSRREPTAEKLSFVPNILKVKGKTRDIGVISANWDTLLKYSSAACLCFDNLLFEMKPMYERIQQMLHFHNADPWNPTYMLPLLRNFLLRIAHKGKYDIVVIILPPNICPVAQMMIAVSDLVLVPSIFKDEVKGFYKKVVEDVIEQTRRLRKPELHDLTIEGLPTTVQIPVFPDRPGSLDPQRFAEYALKLYNSRPLLIDDSE